MELLVFVGALVALAVASRLWGHASRDWEPGSGWLDVDYVIENELRGRRVWLDRRAALLAQLRPRRPAAHRPVLFGPALIWFGRHLIRWGVVLQRRYAPVPSLGEG